VVSALNRQGEPEDRCRKKANHNLAHSGTPQLLNIVVSIEKLYLFSKSTGSFTSVTRRYLASAGYFLATASYMEYATLR
jgi:hypothetical protein